MQLRLVIVEGPRKGEEFNVKSEITIGRKSGDLQLLDDKASTLHAKISVDHKIIYIEDLGSSNGTLVNGQKITKSEIKPGDTILIGRTLLRIEDVPAVKNPPQLGRGTWQETVDKALTLAIKKYEKLPVSPKRYGIFTTPIALEFVRGLQTGNSYVFGFGPRQVGSYCIDALLCEPGSPAVVFELHPVAGAACEIRTFTRGVMVNDVEVKTQHLKIGDRISFGQTVIVVKSADQS